MGNEATSLPPHGQHPEHFIRLPLRCAHCGQEHEEEVEQILVHPNPNRCVEEGWDGVVLSRVIVCPRCGAEDGYALTTMALLILHREMKRAHSHGRLQDGTSSILMAEGRIWSGETIHRQSHALSMLAALTEKHPKSGEAWRRLGNTERRLGRREVARTHYLKACEVDEQEAEAALNLAEMLWEEERYEEVAQHLNSFLMRLGRAVLTPKERQDRAEEAVDLLRSMLELSDEPISLLAAWAVEPPRPVAPIRSRAASELSGTPEPTVTISTVDLRSIRRWRGLVEVLASPSLLQAGLTSELPEDPGTILAARIEGRVTRHPQRSQGPGGRWPGSHRHAKRGSRKKPRR